MAAPIILFDRNTDVGRRIVRYLQMVREAREGLAETLAVLVQMRDGDGSQASHYDLLAVQAGFTAGDYADANTAAKASHDELASLIFKLTTNSSITDMLAAMDQACAKHGV